MQKLIILLSLIFVVSCAGITQSKIDDSNIKNVQLCCQPIYGHDSDWDKISDDLARNIYRHNKLCE